MDKEYYIQAGENFHGLAQRWGGTCDDFLLVNPGVDPLKLQIGQKIVLPEFKATFKGQEQYADIHADHGQEFVGDYLDDVEMEVEGVRFRLRRIGEPKIPHEIHFILPRTEIRKVQPAGDGGPYEVQIMLSNLDIVHSPRLVSGNSDKAEQAKSAGQMPVQTNVQHVSQQPQPVQTEQTPQTPQTPQTQIQQPSFVAASQYGQGALPVREQSPGLASAKEPPRWRMTFPFHKN